MRAAVALLLVACGRPATVVTVKLVDPRRVTTPDTADRAYLVEVHSAPLSFLDRVRAGALFARGPDTIPGLRVPFLPVVLDDSVVVGFWTMAHGGPAGTFSYDVATRRVTRGPLPVWIHDLADFSHPALSPDTRHLAYVALTPEGQQHALVRHWPDGNVVARGPGGPRQQYRQPGRAMWLDHQRYRIAYDAAVPPYPVRFIVHGSLTHGITRVDTLPWYPGTLTATDGGPAPAVAPGTPPEPAVERTEIPPDDVWDRAARQIQRLAPAAFPELPTAFRAELESRGCTIPQSGYRGGPPHNVIRGSFGARGQTDWAALCSRDGRSVILLHWGGAAQCPRELQPAVDRGFLQGVGGGRIAFSRGISPRSSYHVYPDEGDTSAVDREVPLEHDGIDDAFEGKASTVWFCRAGKWIALAGAD
jgi:hypothetical protein